MKRVLLTVSPVVLGVALGLAVVAPFATALRLSEAAAACGGEGNTVQAEFELQSARDIWQRFPHLGISPELEIDERPARVVVFKGEFVPQGIGVMGNPNAGEERRSYSRAICVIQADGTVNLYTNVSRTGSGFED